jgi:hypothetical protein
VVRRALKFLCHVKRRAHGFRCAVITRGAEVLGRRFGRSLESTSNMSGEFLRNDTGARDAEVPTAMVRLAAQEIELLVY